MPVILLARLHARRTVAPLLGSPTLFLFVFRSSFVHKGTRLHIARELHRRGANRFRGDPGISKGRLPNNRRMSKCIIDQTDHCQMAAAIVAVNLPTARSPGNCPPYHPALRRAASSILANYCTPPTPWLSSSHNPSNPETTPQVPNNTQCMIACRETHTVLYYVW